MPDLSADELTDLRDNYIQDRVDETATPKVYLSRYNLATRREFVTDEVLQAMNADVEADQDEELDRLQDVKRMERLRFGDSDADAETAGITARTAAKFRLIRARVRRLMIADTLFMQTLGDQAGTMKSTWKDQVTEDENYARVRQGGFASIRMQRR